MASLYERDYAALVNDVLMRGNPRQGSDMRNGGTLSSFAKVLTIRRTAEDFPLLHGRKLYPEAVMGEFAAFLRGPQCLADFAAFGCNYWKLWAKEDGSLNVDYGNAWYDYNGINQVEEVVNSLQKQPYHRRHIITGWRPDRLNELSLPCCHMLYQWYTNGRKLDMIWYQRSADIMIGVPSDVILATVFNACMAKETGLIPGNITMIFGDAHIYEEHIPGAQIYLDRVKTLGNTRVSWQWSESAYAYPLTGPTKSRFIPQDIIIGTYNPKEPIKFELKK